MRPCGRLVRNTQIGQVKARNWAPPHFPTKRPIAFCGLNVTTMGGSGGQRSRSKPRTTSSVAATKEVHYKLESLADEELRKWSSVYGYSDKGTRAKLLEQLNGHADGIMDPCRSAGVKNLPIAPPPFTLSQIQAAIPRHCFKRRCAPRVLHFLCTSCVCIMHRTLLDRHVKYHTKSARSNTYHSLSPFPLSPFVPRLQPHEERWLLTHGPRPDRHSRLVRQLYWQACRRRWHLRYRRRSAYAVGSRRVARMVRLHSVAVVYLPTGHCHDRRVGLSPRVRTSIFLRI